MKRSVDITIHVTKLRWKTLLKPYTKHIRQACEAALAGRAGELSVVLADDAAIRQMNHSYRGKNKATNVLSFAGEGKHLGDIVLALETIEREAKEQHKSVKAHATHLIVHGCLHLLGFDHEEEGEAGRMEKREIKIMEKLGFSNPYL